MKNIVLFALLCFSFFQKSYSQRESNVRVDGIMYVTKTQAQRLAILEPKVGMTCYQSDGDAGFYVYTATGWESNGLTKNYKNKIDSSSIFLAQKVDKVTGKTLTSNDYTTAEKTKLTGIQSGATANSTDSELRDRATHTGLQAISTISGLQQSLDGKLSLTGGTVEVLTTNSELNLIGQKSAGNDNSKITITNQGFGADSRLTFTQSNYIQGAGWQFGEDIMNVHGSYFGFAGNSNPQATIDLGSSGTFKIGSSAGNGKVLTSDASGNATWQTISVPTTSSNKNIVTINGATVLTSSNDYIISMGSTSYEIGLPDVSTNVGKEFWIKNRQGNKTTSVAYTNQVGSSTNILNAGTIIHLVSDGAIWQQF